MPVEADFLLWVNGLSSGPLDLLFVVSHYIGGGHAWAALVTLAVIYSAARGARRHALTWLALGVGVDVTQRGLKALFGRVRPALWDGPVHHVSAAMPSGHALAAAAFYGFAAHVMARVYPSHARRAYAAGAVAALYVGFGRLYLGVHWPSDVVVGWCIGALYAWLACRFLDRELATRAA